MKQKSKAAKKQPTPKLLKEKPYWWAVIRYVGKRPWAIESYGFWTRKNARNHAKLVGGNAKVRKIPTSKLERA